MSETIEEAWRAAKAVVGPHKSNEVLVAHGGKGGVCSSIPSHRVLACIQSLDALADGDDDEKELPQSVSDLHDRVYAKWNRKTA